MNALNSNWSKASSPIAAWSSRSKINLRVHEVDTINNQKSSHEGNPFVMLREDISTKKDLPEGCPFNKSKFRMPKPDQQHISHSIRCVLRGVYYAGIEHDAFAILREKLDRIQTNNTQEPMLLTFLISRRRK